MEGIKSLELRRNVDDVRPEHAIHLKKNICISLGNVGRSDY